jgi:serralysin
MPSIVEIAAGNANFNILVAALGFVDSKIPGSALVSTLSASGANLTVFAPTDAGFGQLAKDLGFTGNAADETAVTVFLTTSLTPETIRDVLLYHVSAGAKTLAQIAASPTVTTLNGTITADGVTLVDKEPDLINPSLVQTDIHATNGIIHAIDRVLLPFNLPGNDAKTITGIVAASGEFDANAQDFDFLLAAVKAAGLAGALDDKMADLTVFAPNDAAFSALAKTLGYTGTTEAAGFAYLVDALTLLSGGTDPLPLLKNILLYHVAPESLQASQVLGATSLPTLLGATIGVSGTTLVDKDPDLANPKLIATDIQAANGVVHVIDKVLIPADLLVSNGANDVRFIVASNSANVIHTGADNDLIDGNGGNDVIFARAGNDIVLGGTGSDNIFGGQGNDALRGDAGRDGIYGGAGDDRITGGAGFDQLFGGGGADVFVFATGDGRDRVFDFRNGVDKIDLSGAGITSFAELADNLGGNEHRAVIDLGDGDKIVLEGFALAKLDATDFVYADGVIS